MPNNVVSLRDLEGEGPDEDGDTYRRDDDGGMTITLGGGLGSGAKGDPASAPFGANLAEWLDESALSTIANDTLEGIQADLDSRKEWEELLKQGMELLGFKIEDRTTPFKGAAGVFHPVMTEAVVRFQASARGEMLPAAGPVRTQIIGDSDPDVEARAERVKDYFNYWCTELNQNYYPEFDRMLVWIGICGNGFKKVFHNPLKGGPDSPFILPDQLVVNYGATSLDDATRVTQIIPTTKTEMIRLQLMKIYRDIDLAEPSEETSLSQETRDKLDGLRKETPYGEDRHTLYETHTDIDIPVPGLEHLDDQGSPSGLPLPYIVTIDRDSQKIVGLYRNWDENDPTYKTGPKRLEYFVHYGLLPGTGFYYFGFAHILGGIAKGSTMLMRQLLDSGTLANFPGGLRVKGMKTDENAIVVGPCEFKEIDTGGLPIQDAVMALPYKDPSEVLLAMLQNLVESAQRLGATADMQVGEGRQDAPVGTTISMIEQAQKVMSAIHKRLHVSQRKELRLLGRVLGREPGLKYPYRVAGQNGVALSEDFNEAMVDILPVTDPNIPTQAQRLALLDARMKMAQGAPQLHNLKNVYEDFYTALGMSKAEVARQMAQPQTGQPADPITEFAMVLKGAPLMVGPQQNHDAHIAAHTMQLQIPGILKSPASQPLQSHLYDHIAAKYREAVQVQLAQQGIQLPPQGPLPPQVEGQLSVQIAQAGQAVLKQFQQSMDPVMALQQRELDLKQLDLQLKKEDSDRKVAQNAADQKAELAKTMLDLRDNTADRQSRELQGDQKIIAAHIAANANIVAAGIQAGVDQAGMARDIQVAQLDTMTELSSHNTDHHAADVDAMHATAAQTSADAEHRQIDLDTKRIPIEQEQAKAATIVAKKPVPKPAPKAK